MEKLTLHRSPSHKWIYVMHLKLNPLLDVYQKSCSRTGDYKERQKTWSPSKENVLSFEYVKLQISQYTCTIPLTI